MTAHAAALIRLRLKGFMTPEAVGDEAAALVAAGLAESARLGLRLTPAGRAAADIVWADERAAADPLALEVAHGLFVSINAPFKALVGDWQLRDGIPNDHSDAAYDAGLLARLDDVHARVLECMAMASAQVARLGRYAPAFSEALEKLRRGERRWMAAPIVDSYHSLWFELHEELIQLTGRTRAAEAASGTAA